MKKLKIVTLLGIRPDIIRMFKLIEMLDKGQEKNGYEHIFGHTGQHFDYELDKVFYEQLGVRQPDFNLRVGQTLKERGGKTSHAYQAALLYEKVAEMIETYKPDVVMYLGDTNSVLSSVVVSRYGIPVVHIEAGGRSYDWRMPEEKNRIVIDHLSDALYCYMPRHKEILVKEGVEDFRLKVVGNIIYDALERFLPIADTNTVLEDLHLKKDSYALVTLHREENTSEQSSLSAKLADLIKIAEEIPVIWPLMPRVKGNLEKFGLYDSLIHSKITITKPLGYLEFLKLQKEAKVIITDSGTVQEEAAILGVPAVIARRSTERPETIIAKASILDENDLYNNVKKAMVLDKKWDRNLLNTVGGSPSEIIYSDLVEKIASGYFEKSRSFDQLKCEKLVREAYGK
jgi:UDP-N-acetylglucosamine 2-epimerase (non-hydrolysing)